MMKSSVKKGGIFVSRKKIQFQEVVDDSVDGTVDDDGRIRMSRVGGERFYHQAEREYLPPLLCLCLPKTEEGSQVGNRRNVV